ncbi:MAG TPA: DUF488 domain-containing protein, partial [Ktedonobacterales bacterium]|nr:DUF488 domain-containing protein [Ktedonobacterales bacterium]
SEGQLAGFAKQQDLAYFLTELLNCKYTHLDALAPTGEILSTYRKDHDWQQYVKRFEELMDQRESPQKLPRDLFERDLTCLLCSEATPEQCHRRLVAERLKDHWGDVEIVHLV